MVALMLHDAGVEAVRLARDRLAREAERAVAHPARPRHGAAQAGERQAPLPVDGGLVAEGLDLRVDEDRHRRRLALLRRLHPHRSGGTSKITTRSGTCTCGAARPAPLMSASVWRMSATRRRTSGCVGSSDRLGAAGEHGMSHAGDLEYGHGRHYASAPRGGQNEGKARNGSAGGRGSFAAVVLHSRARACYKPAPAGGRGTGEGHRRLQVLVRDNNVDQALRALKKKMQREGIFREMKMRRAYEKPSERRAREKAEAIRRTRKLARKRAQRDE